MMKRKVSTIIGLVSLCFMLVGCHEKSSSQTQNSQKATSSSTSVKKIKANKPSPSETTSLLNPLQGKFAEDQQTRTNGGEVTYSNIYWKKDTWHWQLTSNQRNIIVDATIKSMSQSTKSDPYTLEMVNKNGDEFSAKLTVTTSFYTIETDYKNIKGTYIVGDADGNWKNSAPKNLQGGWKSAMVDSKIAMGEASKDYPYAIIHYSISSESIDTSVTLYKTDKKTKLDGSNWGVNNNLMYQEVKPNVYLLKSYIGDELTFAFKVKYIDNNNIRVSFSNEMVNFVRGPESSINRSDSNDVDTTNLTDKQVNRWVWKDLQSLNKDYGIASWKFTKQTKNGMLYINTQIRHGVPNEANGYDEGMVTTSVIERYRINQQGQLERYKNGWKLTSTPYPN